MRINRRLLQSIAMLGLAVLILYRIADQASEEPNICRFTQRGDVDELVYVDHARCRMRCRSVDQRTVERVYRDGVVNCRKSNYKDGKPRYALEKRDDRGDKIRVIVEDDEGQHIIVTVIRLGQGDHCSCS